MEAFPKYKFKDAAMPKIATSLGYKEPYSNTGFNKFLAENPETRFKYEEFQKQAATMMARGGAVKKVKHFDDGGDNGGPDDSGEPQEEFLPPTPTPPTPTPPTPTPPTPTPPTVVTPEDITRNTTRLSRLASLDPNKLTEEEIEERQTLLDTTPFNFGNTEITPQRAKARYEFISRKQEEFITEAERRFLTAYSSFSGQNNPFAIEPVDPTNINLEETEKSRLKGEVEDTAKVTAEQTSEEDDQLIDTTTGQLSGTAPSSTGAVVEGVSTAPAITAELAASMTASEVSGDIVQELSTYNPASGELSNEAVIVAANLPPSELAQLGLSPAQLDTVRRVAEQDALALQEGETVEAAERDTTPTAIAAERVGEVPTADAATFDDPTPQASAQDQFTLTPTQAATQTETQVAAAAKASEIPSAEAIQTTYESSLTAAQGRVGSNELVNAREQGLQIDEPITAIAAVMSNLNDAAVAKAQQGSFSQLLAKPAQGTVEAKATVQGQIATLMDQFNNGSTPVWAAGAMRAANAAMASRGLGGSSMASSAIIQATMEAAIPIAQQDAQTFNNMGLTNLANRQQVALTNAAAQQNLELANLSNRQQTELQNSANAFSLQSQSLSNSQAVVLANAQIAAAAQNKNLDVRTQTALVNAARFAEVNNINLSNRQQANLQRSSENLQVDLTNLSEANRTSLANLQVRASLIGQELSNEQQVAMLTSTQSFQRANFDATSQQQAFLQDSQARLALEGKAMDTRQQTSLFNVSSELADRKLELTNEQQTSLFNTTNVVNFDLQDLSNRQQAALANAQIDAALTGQELTNKQQANVINAARIGEIANLNFTTKQQTAIENARLAQTVDLANLDSRKAKVLADSAAMSQTDLTNLNNRQTAAVNNAKSFLQMDLTNLSNEQQKLMFDSQALVTSMLSDQAATNSARQFNATSEQQNDQFFANLSTAVSQFNVNQQNGIAQFNASQIQNTNLFNTNLQNQRDQWNGQNALVVAQSNAQWRRQIATADTAALNRQNEFNASAALGVSNQAYANIQQFTRDIMFKAIESSENALDRETRIATAIFNANASSADLAARLAAAEDAGLASAIGGGFSAALSFAGTKTGGDLLDSAGSFLAKQFKFGN